MSAEDDIQNAGTLAELEHFKKVKETNWSESKLITCGRYFSVAKCTEDLNLLFKCAICNATPGVFISADTSSVHNLRSHIKVGK